VCALTSFGLSPVLLVPIVVEYMAGTMNEQMQ
jgi:hypothetical protein